MAQQVVDAVPKLRQRVSGACWRGEPPSACERASVVMLDLPTACAAAARGRKQRAWPSAWPPTIVHASMIGAGVLTVPGAAIVAERARRSRPEAWRRSTWTPPPATLRSP